MHNSRNIIKRYALSRCPPPAFGKAPAKDTMQAGQLLAQARLANCCRKLYTKLLASGWDQLADVARALGTRRRKFDMTWLKLTCRLRKANTITEKPKVLDYLSAPLKHCFELHPAPNECDSKLTECVKSADDVQQMNWQPITYSSESHVMQSITDGPAFVCSKRFDGFREDKNKQHTELPNHGLQQSPNMHQNPEIQQKPDFQQSPDLQQYHDFQQHPGQPNIIEQENNIIDANSKRRTRVRLQNLRITAKPASKQPKGSQKS